MANMTFEIIFSVTATIISIISIIISIISRNRLSFSEQISNITEFLNNAYHEKSFTYKYILFDYEKLSNYEKSNYKLNNSAEKNTTIWQGRKIFNEFLESNINEKNEVTRIDTYFKNFWILKNKYPDIFYDSFEYNFIKNLAVCLETIGVIVLNGGISFKILISLNGYQILKDWYYCLFVVNKQRKEKELTFKSNKDINFQKIHAEWLAYATAIYVQKKLNSLTLDNYIKKLGGINKIKRKESQIRNVENNLIHNHLNSEFKKLLK